MMTSFPVTANLSEKVNSELKNLANFSSQIPLELKSHLVAHRGFHHTQDSLTRPLENTLRAFEMAWRSGLWMCECDVTHSKDGKVIFCHDANFERLAMVKDQLHATSIEELTYDELKNIRLKDDSSVLTLDDVFEFWYENTKQDLLEEKTIDAVVDTSAIYSMNDNQPLKNAQLVIEIKRTGDPEKVSEALLDLMFNEKYIQFLYKIPIIMSFRQETAYLIKKKLQRMNVNNLGVPKVMALVEIWKKHPNLQSTKDHKVSFDLCNDNAVEVILKELLTDGEVVLDGIYMQFEDKMLNDPKGFNSLKKLCDLEGLYVGVFFSKTQVDKLSVVGKLRDLGVDFINTDIPKANRFFTN